MGPMGTGRLEAMPVRRALRRGSEILPELPAPELRRAELHNATETEAAMQEPVEQPPIGLRPEHIFEYEMCRDRIFEIFEAIARYSEAQKPIPYEWCEEMELRLRKFVLLRA